MVLLGGLEIVAAGYLINKHQKNKRERQRIEDERLALEEEQYHLFPPEDERHGRRHRSHSERRHSDDRHERRRSSRERRHSRDRKPRRESPPPRPASTTPVPPRHDSYSSSSRPSKHSADRLPVQQMSQPVPQSMPRPPPQPQQPYAQPQAQPYPQPYVQPQQQDVKYGWTDNEGSSSRLQHDGPPTGWPEHWEQSQRPERSALRPSARAQGANQSAESLRGRSNSRVRFNLPEDVLQPGERAQSYSPPPEYRP
ncbi:hypothetical protein G7Y89_g7290 [Cudoniella acicularis]|uniref:Uncharacterized protein n=1 Tax=Cudoniella acicularis TaxID=354080 RepID=A0A8H4W1P4_9HELO|nr:hypothetical protein G7Y89_g7290 [Cudoniella acicularis]